MEADIKELFARYEQFFQQSLSGKIDKAQLGSLYATEFIAATPAGVLAGKNDASLAQALEQGYAHYREIGTKAMTIRRVTVSPIDDLHCIAHVEWTAVYARKQQADVASDFVVHYFVQRLNGEPKIFGWVSGDEQALLKQHGIE